MERMTKRDGVNGSMFDRFSLLHFGAGAIKQRLGLSIEGTIALAILWEAVEDDLKDRFPRSFPHASHDSKRNAMGDVISSLAGFYVAKKLKR